MEAINPLRCKGVLCLGMQRHKLSPRQKVSRKHQRRQRNMVYTDYRRRKRGRFGVGVINENRSWKRNREKADSAEENVSHLGTWVKRATFQVNEWVLGLLETISEGKIRREDRVCSSGRGRCTWRACATLSRAHRTRSWKSGWWLYDSPPVDVRSGGRWLLNE